VRTCSCVWVSSGCCAAGFLYRVFQELAALASSSNPLLRRRCASWKPRGTLSHAVVVGRYSGALDRAAAQVLFDAQRARLKKRPPRWPGAVAAAFHAKSCNLRALPYPHEEVAGILIGTCPTAMEQIRLSPVTSAAPPGWPTTPDFLATALRNQQHHSVQTTVTKT